MVALTAGNKLAVLADGIFLKKNPTMRGVWSSFSDGEVASARRNRPRPRAVDAGGALRAPTSLSQARCFRGKVVIQIPDSMEAYLETYVGRYDFRVRDGFGISRLGLSLHKVSIVSQPYPFQFHIIYFTSIQATPSRTKGGEPTCFHRQFSWLIHL